MLVRIDDHEIDVPALRESQRALRWQAAELLKLIRPDGYTAEKFMELKSPIDAKIGKIDRQLAEASKTDPLSDLVSADDVSHRYSLDTAKPYAVPRRVRGRTMRQSRD